MSDNPLWHKTLEDGSTLEGVKGGVTHSHDHTGGLGIGHIKDQQTGEKIGTFNTFNDKVDELLPDFMKK